MDKSVLRRNSGGNQKVNRGIKFVENPPGSNKYNINREMLFEDFHERFCQIAGEVRKREKEGEEEKRRRREREREESNG